MAFVNCLPGEFHAEITIVVLFTMRPYLFHTSFSQSVMLQSLRNFDLGRYLGRASIIFVRILGLQVAYLPN